MRAPFRRATTLLKTIGCPCASFYSSEHTIRLRLFDLLFFRRSRGGPALMLSEVRSFSPFGSSCQPRRRRMGRRPPLVGVSTVIIPAFRGARLRSEEHTSELQSLMRISYSVFCLKKKNLK